MGAAGDQLVGDPGAGVDAPPLRDTVGDAGQAVRRSAGQVGRLGGHVLREHVMSGPRDRRDR